MNDTPTAARLAEIAAAHLGLEGPLLPILHEVQREFGYIPEEAPEVLAKALNLGRAEVHGVISFYHDFRQAPVEGVRLRLCRAEACQAMGGEALAQEIAARLGADWHKSSADGRVTLEPVFCLGLCACAPAAEVGGRLVGRATAERILGLLGGEA